MKPITILSPGRSGTRLLMQALRSHPQIKSNIEEPLCYHSNGYKSYWPFIIDNFQVNPAEYIHMNQWTINTDIFNRLACQRYLDAVEQDNNLLKILYGHMIPPVTNWLIPRDHVFVNLSRKNLLRGIMSMFFLLQFDEQGEFKDTIYINPDVAVDTIAHWLRYERFCDMLFGKRVIKIYYEDLIKDWEYWLHRIQHAAGIGRMTPEKEIVIDSHSHSFDCIENQEVIPYLQQIFGNVIIGTHDA